MGMFKRLFGKEDVDWQTGTQPVATPPPAPVTAAPVQFEMPDVKTMMLMGEQAKAAMRPFEATVGMDLDGDGKIGDGPGAPAAPPISSIFTAAAGGRPADDVVSQLERLAALKASGALTEAEFAAEKAKVLAGG